MKKLIALAAVLGLAVSSWGLTVQDAPSEAATPPAGGVVLAEAELGSYMAPVIWRTMNHYGWVTEQAKSEFYPHFEAMVEGAFAATGALVAGGTSGGLFSIIGAGAGAL